MNNDRFSSFLRRLRFYYVLLIALFISACGYRQFATALRPLGEKEQVPEIKMSDDGTVTYIRERLEISLRPMTDEELNRQFPGVSEKGNKSTNPYTYGDWRPRGEKWTPTRFTVFRLKVKNYTYPKMLVDPTKMVIVAEKGQEYSALSLRELEQYYYPYAKGYAGVEYSKFEERKDILKRTLYPVGNVVFSGQELEGYVAFPKLDPGVRQIAVKLYDVILRFNVMGEPVEATDLTFRFQREVYKAREPRS